MNDYSVEICHIYTNAKIDEEHKLSRSIVKPLVAGYQTLGKSHSVVTMIDDYSFPDPSFSYDDFIKWLKSDGTNVDKVIRESQLIPYCDIVVDLLNTSAKEQITHYVKSKKKYPCSLFIAAWYLIRLGKITSELLPPELTARQLVNILPESFKPFEDKGFELIATTVYADANKQIENIYIKGRQVA